MKQLFILIGLGFLLSLTSTAQVNAKSGSVTTQNPKNCHPIDIGVNWEYWCQAYNYTGLSHSISGSTITISINYTFSGVCGGTAISKTDTAKLNSIPNGTYTVVIQGVLNGTSSTPVTLSNSLIVLKCCAVEAEIIGDTTSYCLGDTIRLKSKSTNSTRDRWFINGVLKDSTTNFSYIASSGGLDTITLVTDTTTCSDTSFTSLKILKDPKLINDTTVCLKDFIFIQAPTGWNKYKWSTGNTGVQQVSLKSGTYSLTVTSHSGCEKSDSVKIAHLGPQLSLGADTFFCKGSSVDIQVGSIWKSVVWNYDTADTNRTKSVDSAGTYVAEVINSLGCKFTDAVKVTEIDTTLIVMSTKPVCKGNSVKLYVAPGSSNLKWSNGSTTDTIIVVTGGNYSATANNLFGCRTAGNGTAIINDNPIPQLGNDTSKCNKDNIVLNPGKFKKYKWVFGSTSPVFIVNNAGTYYVEVEDSNSCFGADTIVIASIKCDTTTEDTTVFVRTINSQESVKIYPNPANDHLFIKALGNSDLSIGYILDLKGRIVSKINLTGTEVQKIDISEIAKGTYILSLQFESGEEVRQKMLIE